MIPVLNEEKALAGSVRRVHEFLSAKLDDREWRIVVADNGSTDGTQRIARALASEYETVHAVRLEQRGRGLALRKAWLESGADVLCYTDVDLSTDLEALPKLLGAIEDGGYDIAVGSRLRNGSRVIGRPPHREFISRVYNLIVPVVFQTRFSFRDAQCGFKALSRKAVGELVPLVEDNSWFFDSELLIIADKNGYRIKEVPVTWRDDPDSRVRLVTTAYADLKGLLRLRFGGLKRASRLLVSNRGAGA